MKSLYLDTHSTKNFFLGFQCNKTLSILQGDDASCQMIDYIDKLTNNNFEEIIINKGPGSLTGLRIGSSFAQGLSLSKNIPIFGISLWDILLNEYPDSDIFFYTGTRKWIKKNSKEEVITENDFNSNLKSWISNKKELLISLDQKKNIPFPTNLIQLMCKYRHLATKNIEILYPINLFF